MTWTRVANVQTYVFVRKVPGQADQYSVVSGTSTTPPPVPGVTVRYSVRTTVKGSAWASEQSITYPPPTETRDAQAAPAMSVSGQTLAWNAIAGVSTYVLATQVPGKAEQYSVVSGTSTTPPPVPGVTVRYSVRTAVEGSAWSPEVSISYPSATTTPPASPPVSGGGSTTGFEMGAVPESMANSEPGFIQSWVPAASGWNSKSAFRPRRWHPPGRLCERRNPSYAAGWLRQTLAHERAGAKPRTWAAEFGPGGSFWQGKSFPAGAAMTTIEFGNETSYTYQFSDNSTAAVAARAQTYALRLKEA